MTKLRASTRKKVKEEIKEKLDRSASNERRHCNPDWPCRTRGCGATFWPKTWPKKGETLTHSTVFAITVEPMAQEVARYFTTLTSLSGDLGRTQGPVSGARRIRPTPMDDEPAVSSSHHSQVLAFGPDPH